MNPRWVLPLLLAPLLAGCIGADDASPPADTPTTTPAPTAPFQVSSSAFGPGEPIPSEYTCDGENVNPPLAFDNAPLGTATFALIMDDPDAPSGTVLHWTFWNLPLENAQVPRDADMAALGAREGQTYRGSCPPDGEHRYFFYAYAVDAELDLAEGAGRDQLEAALAGHTLAEHSFHGTYNRLPVDLPALRTQ